MPKTNSEDRIKPLLESANETAHTTRNIYDLFLLAGTYIAIIIGSTTDEQLFKVSPVTLPLLNVGMPIVGFYIVIPWFFVLFHFNLLLQLYLLGSKLHPLDAAITKESDEIRRNELCSQLSSFPFVQMLTGHHHSPMVRFFLTLVIWITVIFLPVTLLSWAQIRFLPYHEAWITWVQRGALVLDVVQLWIFWPLIVGSKEHTLDWGKWVLSRFPHWRHGRWRQLQKLRSGEKRVGVSPLREQKEMSITHPYTAFSLTLTSVLILFVVSLFSAQLPEGPDEWRDALLHRNLDLSEKVLVDGNPSAEVIVALQSGDQKEQEQALKKVTGLNLEKRDLRFANLSWTIMPKVNLRGARLQGADLIGARLQGADLGKFYEHLSNGLNLAAFDDLNGGVLEVQLQGANLNEAQLQGATLVAANLQGATLLAANLQGANLVGANLQGADLRGADLRGAVLGADLQDNIIFGRDLGGEGLLGADLRGADLGGADLRGAVLMAVDHRGASLREAWIGGAQFPKADLRLCDLRGLRQEPLSKEIYDNLERGLEENMRGTWFRPDILGRLEKAVGRLGTLKGAETTSGALCDEKFHSELGDCFLEDQIKHYDAELLVFLTKLGCADIYVARGLASRATTYTGSAAYIFSSQHDRAFWSELSKALLAPDCKGGASLPGEVRTKLQEIIS